MRQTGIGLLEMDEDNLFVISHNDKMDKELGGTFGYSGKGDIFNTQVNSKGDNKVASLAHELTHGFQYLEGKVDFIPNGKGEYDAGTLHGREDEWDANERAKLLGGGMNSSQFERSYNGLQPGSKSLGEMNDKQLERYKKLANKQGWKYNYE